MSIERKIGIHDLPVQKHHVMPKELSLFNLIKISLGICLFPPFERSDLCD
jgi:hypothetical protein